MLKRGIPALVLFFVIMPLNSYAIPGFMKARMGFMEGAVFFADKPVADATLAFFDVSKGLPPIERGMGRLPDFRGYTGPDGKFRIQLIAGSYYLGVLLRHPGDPAGPPRAGEIYYFANDGSGKLRKLPIEDYKESQLGRINCSLPEVFKERESHFTVEGVVVGSEGEKPYVGALVFAKSKPTMMRPEYLSKETGVDGRFSIQLPPDRTFYLVARGAITGKRPEPGEDIGQYGPMSGGGGPVTAAATGAGGPPPGVDSQATSRIGAMFADAIPVSGKDGEMISGLTIKMFKMPDQKRLQNKIRSSGENPDYESGVALKNLYFAKNSIEINERSFAELDQWVRFLKGRLDVEIELIGHTDNTGSDEYNLQLSQKRAEAVARYLMEKGIRGNRIKARGEGKLSPVADNGTAEGRGRNRRVDIRFKK